MRISAALFNHSNIILIRPKENDMSNLYITLHISESNLFLSYLNVLFFKLPHLQIINSTIGYVIEK